MVPWSAIQDAFRRTVFPIERAGKVRQVTFAPGATAPVEMVERQRWEYRNRGETVVGGDPGTMVVRIVQNGQGHSLPPDLTAAAPKYSRSAGPGELLTLIDMDHYVEGTFDPDPEWVVARACELHDHIVETFHEHVVTGEAVEEWK